MEDGGRNDQVVDVEVLQSQSQAALEALSLRLHGADKVLMEG